LLLALLVPLTIVPACDDADDGDTMSSDGDASDGSDTDGSDTDDSDTDGSDTDDSDTDNGGDTEGLPTDPVECGGMTCAAGEICVDTGLVCIEEEGNRHFEDPDDHCAVPPSACEGLSGLDLSDCLIPQLCAFEPDGITSGWFSEGTLQCPAEAPDCF
jgi:hypothetical protein